MEYLKDRRHFYVWRTKASIAWKAANLNIEFVYRVAELRHVYTHVKMKEQLVLKIVNINIYEIFFKKNKNV